MSIIEVKNVSRDYRVFKSKKGFKHALLSLFKREYDVIHAVKDMNFSVNKGELVGYIGPNGAGKSTTIKMLAGILVPTLGKVRVNNMTPYKNRKENAKKIGVVFGQRSQLYWDLPMEDTFELYKRMYKIDDKTFNRNVTFYTDLLNMKDFLRTPVRQLSLGQKMRADIAVSLLHDPDILYLDEPTIGLDVLAKDIIRKFIKEINKDKQTTVILTTHDMIDIENICDRIILIDKGRKMYDGDITQFKSKYSNKYTISVTVAGKLNIPDERIKLLSEKGLKKTLTCNKSMISAGEAVTLITTNNKIQDISIKTESIEEILRVMYRKG